MRSRQIRFGLGVFSIAAAVFAANALSASTFVESLRGSPLVIRLKSVETYAAAHNQPPAGLSKGDVVVVRDNLFNVVPQLGKPAGALVGTDRGISKVINAKTAVVAGTATFASGTLSYKGTVPLTGTRPISLPITGGTGKYAHARGTMTEPGTDNDPSNAHNTFRIMLP